MQDSNGAIGSNSPVEDCRKTGVNPLGWMAVALVAWALVFGIYEILERSVLANASPNLLYILHIVRGTGTSFLLAGIVAWYILHRRNTGEVSGQPSDGLRSIFAEAEAKDLSIQAVWIIKLRWIAILGVVFTTVFCRMVLDVLSDTSTFALAMISVAMIGYNSLFLRLSPKILSGIRVAFAQVFFDLAALTLMIYFTGGIQNPFFLFYIFHIVIAGILLGKVETYLVTAGACLFFCGMTLLIEIGLLPCYPLSTGLQVANSSAQVAGILGAFVITACCTAYFTTTIMVKLRGRGHQILKADEILSQERAKTDNIVRSVGAGLMILDRQTEVVWANEVARKWFGSGIEKKTCNRVWSRNEPCPHQVRLNRGDPSTCEKSVFIGGKRRFFLINCSPICGADGKMEQILELAQDVTGLKEMEIQLVRAGKMVAVGQLAAGISHEINNPLSVVASSAEILSELLSSQDSPESPDIQKHLKKVENNVFRCKEIIQNLLAFSRGDDLDPEEVNVKILLKDSIQLVQNIARKKGVEIRTSFEEGDLRLPSSYPPKIQQTVLNLILNALDATEAWGRVTVSARKKDAGIEIGIEDTGEGISQENLSRIFEPFFTTRSVGKGTGLGLYLCHQFVDYLGGNIEVKSRVGKGTEFLVWIPNLSVKVEGKS